MCPRGTRGAYRKEERVELPKDLQKELVEKASTRFGTLEKLAKKLELPKSSIHYYRTGRLTLPASVLEALLELAGDTELGERVRDASVAKDRTWANAYAAGIHREMCRERVNLPTKQQLEEDDELRRKAAAIVSYVMAEGSIWIQHNRFDAAMANITFADHETDLYDHFWSLCRDVFDYDIGPPQEPGNKARAIRGFICSRFIAEWLMENSVPCGEKSAVSVSLPPWVLNARDDETFVSSIQPWFDGEGHSRNDGRPQFAMGQSRHTHLDMYILPRGLCRRGSGRFMTIGILSRTELFSVSAATYCRALCRSEILDQISRIVHRLGIRTRTYLTGLRLNNNGFWSASWVLRITGDDAAKAADMGLITQRDKLKKLRGNK